MLRSYLSCTLSVIVLTSGFIVMTLANQPSIGIANPASVYCIQQGGTLEIVKDADGNEVGYCKLPDGRLVEEWERKSSQNDREVATRDGGTEQAQEQKHTGSLQHK